MPAHEATAFAPPPPPQPPARPDLRRKLELEAAMTAIPEDRALRSEYFELLNRLATVHTGLQTAVLPELGAPLFFRCGTPDISVLGHVFRDGSFAFEMAPTPLRIVVVGAYAGYSTIGLARRFPRAQIVAAEPLPDNFRLLQLNTLPWRRIRTVPAALWHHNARLATTMRFQADWAVRLNDEAEESERSVVALSMKELLARAGWPGADLVVCDASGGERELFADPMAPWLTALDAALVRLHEQVAPRATEWVNAALPATEFDHRKLGDMELFVRRTPRQALPPAPPELPLLRSEPGLSRFVLADVQPHSFGFFVYDGVNCQLHPNLPGAKPARAMFPIQGGGQRRFVSGVLHAGRPSYPVTFAAAVQREDGQMIAQGEVTMTQRETGRLTVELPEPLIGAARVTLQTTMATGAPNANMAWARWLNPRLR